MNSKPHALNKLDVAFVHEAPQLCTQHPDYECPSIMIRNEDGLPDIDVLDAFREKTFSSRMQQPRHARGIILPPSLYPPTWDHLEKVREPIIQSAKLVNVNLFKKTTNRDKQELNKTEGEGKHFVLACTYNGISKAKQEKEDEFHSSVPVLTEYNVAQPNYDSRHKKHALIGKHSTIRRGPTKGHGKTEPRQSVIDKRNGPTPQNGGHRCPFQIRVNLVEGCYWYIPWKDHHLIHHHGHLVAERGELQAKANQMTESDKRTIEMTAQHFPNGCGLQNMAKQLTGEWR